MIAFSLSVVCLSGNTQITVPWSSSLNVNFGRGTTNPAPPLSVGRTDFTYTTDLCPTRGNYTIVNAGACALGIDATIAYNGIFQNAFPTFDSGGYMMVVNAGVSPQPQVVFEDTVKNLCSNSGYLFWTALSTLNSNSCNNQSFTFSIETTSGTVIKSWGTGNFLKDTLVYSPPNWITVPLTNYAFYFNFFTSYLEPAPKSSFPFFYGFFFTLPPGVTDIVAKISLDPSSAYKDCTFAFALDNIIIMPVSSQIQIANPTLPFNWVIGSCYDGSKPLSLNGSINYDSVVFKNIKYAGAPYANPAFQWQQSLDDGYTWTDIPGENNINLTHTFNNPDTFFVRLRGSDVSNINNLNCSVTSNVIEVQVDSLPKDFNFTSNSPVCEDSDLVFHLSGGASYTISGPNGYSDNIAVPHRYHPDLADSGWYYANIITYGGCSIEDSTKVVIVGPAVKVGAPATVCYGTPVQLSASGGIKYLWSPSSGLSSSDVSNPIATPPTTTKYAVKVTDNSGCSAFASQMVTVIDTFFAARISVPQYACPKDVIEIKDSSEGKIASWQWDLGNGETYNIQNPPSQNFPSGNNSINQYQVKLMVKDSSGCSDTALAIISSVPNCFIAVPTAFTPNNDGKNDYLYPLNMYKASNIIFRVFNRSGQLMFEGRSMNNKWDGTFDGTTQPPGTYVWTLEYTDEKNERISLKGTSVLIR
ncbi:MAG: gliding motility-associated C-terminal domain-containing protein [Bacteroidetes bacterium]|nr:gliding motility-associated C-terminal domain-containing protein [Bacteroidota bacterium]